MGSRPRRNPSPDLSVETAVSSVSMQAILRTLVRTPGYPGQISLLAIALLAIGLSGGLAATLVANVFYLTMQFYYFYGLVLIVAAASALAVERVRRVS